MGSRESIYRRPFKWPEVFRRNTDIVENPHSIYGETIRIPSSEVEPEVLARITSEPAPPFDELSSSLPSGMVPDGIVPTAKCSRPRRNGGARRRDRSRALRIKNRRSVQQG